MSYVQMAFSFPEFEVPPEEADFRPLEAVFLALAGRFWLLKYQDEARRIVLPFAFEEYSGHAVRGGRSFCCFAGAGDLWVRQEGRALRLVMRVPIYKEKKKRYKTICGYETAEMAWHFEEAPYRPPQAPRPRLESAEVPQGEVGARLCGLIGTAVCGRFYSRDPGLFEARSLPFVLEKVEQDGERLRIAGSGGAEVQLTGVQGARIQCYSSDHQEVIVDACHESMGYWASFHLVSIPVSARKRK